MQITLNNQLCDIAEQATLDSIVLSHLGEKQNGIAVAVNNKVIPKSERQNYMLQQNDQILIIKATQGG